MKRILSFLLLSIPLFVAAQKTHTVAAKESFYSIGRMYNVHPKDLASYNNIPFEKGLSIGQVIKIPGAGNAAPMPDVPKPVTTDVVQSEPVKAVKASGSNPIYHTVAPKEGLYGISKKYNSTIADIKKWNNLSSDALEIGMHLVVGYDGTSALTKTETPVVPRPVTKEKETVVAKTSVPEKQEDIYVEPAVPVVMNTNAPIAHNGGYFKAFYNQQIKEKGASSGQDRGEAGIFKSTSGWDDGKYYCLHNSAPAGSFIKITNTANNKSVYAKVLDLMPDLKQNSGIIIRISNAAASELNVTGSSFECSLNY
jgi:LysM repeat protein